jgi:PAS domain S-box-containing protein
MATNRDLPMETKKGPRRRYSLRGQLMLLVASLAVPLLGLQAWWSFHSYQGARQRAETDALAFADATALGVQQFLSFAEEGMMATAASFGEGWLSEDECSTRMKTTAQLLPFLKNALAVDAEGDIICVAAGGPIATNARNWPWFEGVSRNPVFTLGPPVTADFMEGSILPLVAPVADAEGRFVGAIVGSVALVELSELFSGVSVPDDHLVTVATADRIIISRSQDPESHVGDSLPSLTENDELVAPGRWVASGVDLAGVHRMWGQVEIGAGWIVYVGVPNANVYGPARAESFRRIGATLLVLLLGMLLAWRSYDRIAAALHELGIRTRATAVGQIVPLPPNTPDEVTAVVEQFNHTLSERDRAQSAERQAWLRFQSLFDNAVFGLYVSTVDGRFLQVNRALAEMLGYDSEDALIEVGPSSMYLEPDRRAGLLQESLEAGVVPTRELNWLRRDGVPITVRVGGKMIEGPDGSRVFEMIVQDITDEKRTEDELRQTQKMEAIGQLAGGVAHDFNNLLTVIGGNAELLEDELSDDGPLKEDLGQITQATQRAAALTRRLLSLSRKQPRDEQILDMNELVGDLHKMLVPLLGENITLLTELDPKGPTISMDPGELEQIVLNLVLNARDAMPEGGTLRMTTAAGKSGWDANSERLGTLLTVEDTGVGIDAVSKPRIFEPFYTTKPMGKGTGLGLSTVYGVVKRSGGQIRIESERHVGSTMTIWLPMPARPEPISKTPDTVEAAVGTETVLVVEDDELVRRFVARALADVGFNVSTAERGDEALQIVRDGESQIQLVLTDVVMPGLTGPELAERLSTLAPDTPVLFMSGYIDNSFLNAALEQQPDSLIRKPFSAAELRRRVRLALDRSASTSGEV